MGGRHRERPRGRRARQFLLAAVPVIAAAGLVTSVVLGGGALATPAVEPTRAVPLQAAAPAAPVPSWLRDAAAPGPLASVAGDAASAAQDRREQRAQEERDREAEQKAASAGGVCDLEGPPRFDDPAHPNEITNRDCGYVDGQGRERSQDPWIDGQLLSVYGE